MNTIARTMGLLLVCLASYACGNENPDPPDHDQVCLDLEDKAAAVLEGYRDCKADSDCKWVPEVQCLAYCPAAVNVSTSSADLKAEGEKLAAEYDQAGCGCPIADCVGMEELTLACKQNRCVTLMK